MIETSVRMAFWRRRLFLLMTRMATDAPSHFRLPPERTIIVDIHEELQREARLVVAERPP